MSELMKNMGVEWGVLRLFPLRTHTRTTVLILSVYVLVHGYKIAPFKQINLAAPFFSSPFTCFSFTFKFNSLQREWVSVLYNIQHNLVLLTSSFYLFNHPFFCTVLKHARTQRESIRYTKIIFFLFIIPFFSLFSLSHYTDICTETLLMSFECIYCHPLPLQRLLSSYSRNVRRKKMKHYNRHPDKDMQTPKI